MREEQEGRYYVERVSFPEPPEPGENPDPWKETRVVGKRHPRVDAYERVSGTAVYPSDLLLPGTLYGAILRSPHPHAKVTEVDTREAARMEGVRTVLDRSDPEAADILWPYSENVKAGLFDPHCRFEGEAVAAVAAESPYRAWDAIRVIQVKYEGLPFVADERNALVPAAPKIHEGGNRVGPEQVYERGDVEKGFREGDVVREETYRTECELQTPMELHGCVAKWDGDRLTLWESTQGVYAVQERVAEVLGLPLSKVRVVGKYMGGGFGSKLQASKYSIIAALLARKTGRPVKLFLTREETTLAMGNRPPANMRLKAGVKQDGTLTALDFSVLGTGGAYPAGGTALVDWLVRDLYTCPNVRTRTTDVYINTGPARPFRAPGHPQGAWALEQMLDALAEEIRMDPVELRLKNIPAGSQARKGNPLYTTTGLRPCLEEGAKAFGWKEAREKTRIQKGDIRRGVGVASCLWFAGDGGPPSTVILKIYADGSVNLNMGASDIGTGTKTIMALVAAEELGVDPDSIQIEHADTGTTQYAVPSGGSKTVPTEAPAVRDAAIQVKRQLLQMAALDLDCDPEDLFFENKDILSKEDPSKRIRISEISGLKRSGVAVGVGLRGKNPEDKVVNPFAAQFCEVEVNMKTGEVKLLRFLGTNESGRVMNRLTYDNQVFGGIAMGVGFGMTECRVLDRRNGKLVSKNWHDYKLPTAMDVPLDMTSHPIDLPDPEANHSGAKGLGEPVTIPTAAAIANAVYNATGYRVTHTPMTPLNLCRLFSGQPRE
jgi:CO/xanthine dehydrogenase Mo-binding subunit